MTGGDSPDDLNASIRALRSAVASRQGNASDKFRLAVLYTRVHAWASARDLFVALLADAPRYPHATLGLGLCHLKLGSPQQALTYLRRALDETPLDLNLHKLLATAYGQLGDRNKARLHGEWVLRRLDRSACCRIRPPLPRLHQPPPFRVQHARENVISFSLFGNQDRYTRGAVANVRRAGEIYPGWHCRFYCDDRVPRRTLRHLRNLGAAVVSMGRPRRFADALFWRFKVINDPGVRRFLVRDCDSLVNPREQAAVAEWLASDRLFHIMRDYYSHTDLILAGMWGGVGNALPALHDLLRRFRYNPESEESRIADQMFLGQEVWPIVKSSCLIHDSVFSVFGARDFPAGTCRGGGRTVGSRE